MLINAFLRFLEKIGRKRVIIDRTTAEPYLIRYYLFLKNRKSFPFNIFLHHFLSSDPGDLHDHPFSYFTIILKGGYWEWVPVYDSQNSIVGEEKIWRQPGHFRISKAHSFHRIEVDPAVSCWTIFITGPQIREWGFLTHKNWNSSTFNWIHNETYSVRKKQ